MTETEFVGDHPLRIDGFDLSATEAEAEMERLQRTPRRGPDKPDRLSFYVKASVDRPWRGRRGTVTAPALALMDFGEVIAGPVAVHRVRNLAGHWQKVTGIFDYFGCAMTCAAMAYRVRDRNEAVNVYVVGGQLGVWWGGEVQPLLWIEEPEQDLPRVVQRNLGLRLLDRRRATE